MQKPTLGHFCDEGSHKSENNIRDHPSKRHTFARSLLKNRTIRFSQRCTAFSQEAILVCQDTSITWSSNFRGHHGPPERPRHGLFIDFLPCIESVTIPNQTGQKEGQENKAGDESDDPL